MTSPLEPWEQTVLLELARRSIAGRVRGGRPPDDVPRPGRHSERLDAPAACFVTLLETAPGERGRLRGCIGTLEAREPLHRAVAVTARSSAFSDPRFPAVTDSELDGLRIEISVLTPRRPVGGAEAIRIGRDGVEMERGAHRAVFLPQVPVEYGWDVEELLEQLALKAGLSRDGWRGATLFTFQAQVFAEPSGDGGPSR